MIPYFILLLMPSLFALFNTSRVSMLLWIPTFIFYVLFVGLRFQVGPDWIQYGYIHMTMGYEKFWDVILQPEPLSYALFWISENTGNHVYLSNIVGAVVMMTGVFAFASRTINPWLAIVAATPYFVIVMGMSGVRQAMAAGIVLFLLSRWERYSFPTRGIYILVAAMFHTSALVNNIFLVTKLNIALRYKLLLGAVIFLATLYLSLEVSMYADNIARYQERYLGNESLLAQSFGSLYHIAMIAIPAVLGFAYRKRLAGHVHSQALLRFGLYASLSVLVINFFSSTAASRLTVYLYFVPMMVYPALTIAFEKRARLMTTFAILAFHFLLMGTWFGLGNHSFAYVPYRSTLFDGE